MVVPLAMAGAMVGAGPARAVPGGVRPSTSGSSSSSPATSGSSSTAAVLPGSNPRPTPVPVPVIRWARCDVNETVECARVPVPLDYDHPEAGRVSLSLVRLRATDQAHRIGSLFVNPGGPGASGADLVLAAGDLISRAVRGRFDVVGVDPRGVAGSSPLICFDTQEQAQAALAPWAFPVTAAQIAAQRVFDRRVGAACSRHRNPLIDHMSTADVARDLDLLRAAVGDTRLTYLGYSYGTQVGTVYANLFPSRVRAVVLDGVIDPVAWTTGAEGSQNLPFSTRLRSDQGAQRTLNEFFRLCDRAASDRDPSTACSWGPHSAARFASLAAKLRASPLTLPDGSTFGYADLVAISLGALYSQDSWRDLADLLELVNGSGAPSRTAAAGIAATRVDTARVVTARAALAAELGVRPKPVIRTGAGATGRSASGADDGATGFVGAAEAVQQTVEGFAGAGCTDGDNPSRYSAWPAAAARAAARYGYFGGVWTWASSICQPWPGRGDDRYVGPWTHRTARPVLVVGNYFDPATRYQSAKTVAGLLPRARLLSYAGWGHTAFLFGGSQCVDTAVESYLVEGVLPVKGAVCRPEFDPFSLALFSADRFRSRSEGRVSGSASIPASLIGLPSAARRAMGG
jgi:pimeloyl-ACP methyl ester carboxylesterase